MPRQGRRALRLPGVHRPRREKLEGKRWVAYDRQYHRQALARQDLNWSVADPRLYNEAFTGRARSIARCSFCDHAAGQCPRNPHRPIFGWFPDTSTWTTNQSPFGPPSSSQRPSRIGRYAGGSTRVAVGSPAATTAMRALSAARITCW